jgi:hypothetical protein
MAQAARNSNEALLRKIKDLERRLQLLERRDKTFHTVDGPRSDVDDGIDTRMRWGYMDNGTDIGVRIWAADGSLTHDLT